MFLLICSHSKLRQCRCRRDTGDKSDYDSEKVTVGQTPPPEVLQVLQIRLRIKWKVMIKIFSMLAVAVAGKLSLLI